VALESLESEPAQLPVAPGSVRTAALAELGRLGDLVQKLTLADWPKPSAVSGRSIGDVVAHLNLALAVSGRLINAVTAGKGSGRVWKTIDQLGQKVAPVAGPAFNAINSALPRAIDRALSPEVIKGQCATSSRTCRDTLSRVVSEDYTRPVYYRGDPWPLSFFLAAMVNELAIHGWDIASRLDPQAHLSEDARSVLPWFFWSGTPFMLRLPKGTIGTVQVVLSDPQAEMWWELRQVEPAQGSGRAARADVPAPWSQPPWL